MCRTDRTVTPARRGVAARPLAVAVGVVLATTGCGVLNGTPFVKRIPLHAEGAAARTTPAPAPPKKAPPATPPRVAGVTWHSAPTTVHGRAAAYTARLDAATYALWMNPALVRFRYIPGYTYPENGPARAVDGQPSSWVPRLVAAFNGAFKLSDDVGGYFYAGKTVKPLRGGLASLVVRTDGSLRVVVWGRGSTSTAGLQVVRQNLKPLVDHGADMTRPTDTLRTWGYPLHNNVQANRSALGQRADGTLVYVYGHGVQPTELARSLIRLGAVTAIELDMNSGWPGALTYRHTTSGHSAARLSPDMILSRSRYDARGLKDFVAVLTP